jgi:hypothetical protein
VEFSVERRRQGDRILKYIRTQAPKHALADTLLYQWELYKDGVMDHHGLQEQIKSLVRQIVPQEMFKMQGQRDLSWLDVPTSRLPVWLRKWYNSLPNA